MPQNQRLRWDYQYLYFQLYSLLTNGVIIDSPLGNANELKTLEDHKDDTINVLSK